MTKTPAKKKATNKPQGERFRELAKEVGADKDEKALERAFSKVVKSKKNGVSSAS